MDSTPQNISATRESDEWLIKRFVNQSDTAALDEIIRRYTPLLRRLLATLLYHSPQEIEDAEQEVFLSLVTKAHRFRGRSRFSTFFYSLARNRVLDLMRSRKRYVRRHGSGSHLELTESPYSTPVEQLLDNERKQRIQTALESLNEEDRVLLYMKDVEDIGIRELAETTGMRQNTIKSRLKRARKKVSIRLEEELAHG